MYCEKTTNSVCHDVVMQRDATKQMTNVLFHSVWVWNIAGSHEVRFPSSNLNCICLHFPDLEMDSFQ